MQIFGLNPEHILSFFLTLFRISLILFVLPFFGGKSIPNMVKFSLCLVLSWALWPHLSFSGILFPKNLWEIAIMIGGELVIGLTMRLVVDFLFAAVQMGGQIIGFQMGFSMINIADPLTGASEIITSHFLYMTTLLTFLALNGHLYLIRGLADSFALIPPGSLFLQPELATGMLKLAGNIFVMAIRIAAPVMAALFMVDLALALVGRAAPQMHVLILGFPIKIAVGFFFMGILFTYLSRHVEEFISTMGPAFTTLFQLMQH
ncbi:flagellar biosynthetic protein FliR [Desulfobaculum bizertense]|uniref:Flagellar biosynthetic protein FliR n=1 Tax=Desulfobaculum bizertense DSM 18034 TaxID=1121442 RepID=A0A1T4W7M0_9BACT|nr:flagellar biosynthetic protein FliR [Desulfobaculum bizertense]UIJ39093.1 flagellar biosynthetic protein FliR [Desulfobaculum bizertense]SKA73038.1 flagellar biosynthetic protein FliR [Desulfobaculum bizertense DSM 18034]